MGEEEALSQIQRPVGSNALGGFVSLERNEARVSKKTLPSCRGGLRKETGRPVGEKRYDSLV